MKKKQKKNKKQRSFKIGDQIAANVKGRTVYGTVKDKDYALNEYLIWPDRNGDNRVHWVSPDKMRLRRVDGQSNS